MSASKTFLRIQKEHDYLVKNYFVDFFLTLAAIIALRMSDWSPSVSAGKWNILIAFVAIIWGWMISSFLHNSSHENVGNGTLNRLVGEFCGAWVLYGFTNFIMIHHLHHRYSDEKHDPVHPGKMTFLVFISAPMRYMIRETKGWLRERHGERRDYEFFMNVQIVMFHLGLVLKLFLWQKLFGTELFVSFYLPSLISNYAILAHINYVCHRDHADGSVEIVNLNHNLYYKFANFITFGGYFHKNHHIRLSAFNPAKLSGDRYERPYFSVKGTEETTVFEDRRSAGFLKKYFDLQVWGEARRPAKRTSQRTMLMTSARDAFISSTPVTSRVP